MFKGFRPATGWAHCIRKQAFSKEDGRVALVLTRKDGKVTFAHYDRNIFEKDIKPDKDYMGYSEMATLFKLTFRMTAREAGETVCFKQDGQRFDQTHTVKLNTNTTYDVKFTLKPAIYIDKLMINGELHKLEICNEKREESEEIRTYKTQYETTGYDVSKKGNRKELLFVLELENGVYMKIGLQCKFYKAGETDHSHWGQKLTAIDMDCKMEDGHNYVTILKEKYL